MQLIKPSQISGEIMTLIEEADQKLILISPYIRIGKWTKFLNKLASARKRNIDIEFYVRDGEFDCIEEVLNTGYRPIPIPHLHTKLYLNEKEAIVSSMNLLLSSDNNSLDIALKTENKEEYDDLYSYYKRYIQKTPSQHSRQSMSNLNWIDELYKRIFETLNKQPYIKQGATSIAINVFNKYEVFIANERTNSLRIFGILSSKEYDYALKNKSAIKVNNMEIELTSGGHGYYDQVWGTIKGIKSQNINEPLHIERNMIIEGIVNFIVAIDGYKDLIYKMKYA